MGPGDNVLKQACRATSILGTNPNPQWIFGLGGWGGGDGAGDKISLWFDAIQTFLNPLNSFKCTHTHPHTHTHCNTLVQQVTTGDRDASQESVSAVGPPPTPPIIDYHQQMKLYQLFSSKSPLFKSTTSDSVLITSESSRPPQWGSPCVCGQRRRSDNRRDSRVCRNNGEWHRTSSHSGSQIL